MVTNGPTSQHELIYWSRVYELGVDGVMFTVVTGDVVGAITSQESHDDQVNVNFIPFCNSPLDMNEEN
jgi:hypothetical protein